MSLLRYARWMTHLVQLLGVRQALSYLSARAARKDRLEVRIAGVPHPIVVRPSKSDMWALWQVFGLRECAVGGSCRADVAAILDAGANAGYASLFFALAYPEARIVAVEPDLENCRIAEENLRLHGNVTVVRGALWHRTAPVSIENPGDQSWAFRVREGRGAELPGYTVRDLLSASGLAHASLVKIDIEGAELELFRSGSLEWLDTCHTLIIEVHGQQAEDAVTSAMGGRPFSLKCQGEKLVYTRLEARAPASLSIA